MRRRSAAAAVSLVVLITSCSSDATTAPTTPPTVATSTSTESTTSPEVEATAAAPADTAHASTAVPPVTVPPTTAPPTTAPPTTASSTAVPSTPCDGPSTVPATATNVTSIDGDIDGDLHADTVTSYTADGLPHIQAHLFSGEVSDVEIPLGFADSVTVGFEDIDHSAGAATPPPLAVMAIGAGSAGSAFAAFLTLTPQSCIRQWRLNDEPFSLRISQQGPYTGLVCDGAAGSIHYGIVAAEQRPDGQWTISTSELHHDVTTAIVTPLPDQIVPHGPDIAARYGDIVNCTHPLLFG